VVLKVVPPRVHSTWHGLYCLCSGSKQRDATWSILERKSKLWNIIIQIHVSVFWAVTLCSVPVGYQRFGKPCCPLLQFEGPLKRWYPAMTLHGVTIQKTSTWIFTSVKTSNLS
jgi:hypothetical protein